MSQFSYKAVSTDGTHVSGVIEAVDRKSAVATLADKGQFVLGVTQKSKDTEDEKTQSLTVDLTTAFRFISQRITSKDILAVTGQLSTALEAGLPLLNALEIICRQQHKTGMKKLFDQLVEAVSSGNSLSHAMSKHPNIFSPLYISMIRVGETGGILDKTTAQLVEILDRDEKIKTNMKNASVYPAIVLGVGIVSVIVILTAVMPKILATISGGMAVLPWPTIAMLWLSDFLKSFGWLCLIVIVASWSYFRKWSRSSGRLGWDTFKLRIPVLGSVLRTIAVGRFARTLGALTKGGVTILESLSIVRDTLGNELLAGQIDQVAEKVKTGSSLAAPLSQSGFFPPLLVQIISIGEQTGKLDQMLLNAADTFDHEADAAINRFITVFPVILILLLALIIGFIIVAILLPIFMMGLGTGVL